MRGPCLPGTLKVYEAHYDEVLIRGKRYRVVREFFDLDDGFHKVGEEWTFLGSTYSVYDDMLEMQVQFPNRTEWTIPVKWREGRGTHSEMALSYVRPVA